MTFALVLAGSNPNETTASGHGHRSWQKGCAHQPPLAEESHGGGGRHCHLAYQRTLPCSSPPPNPYVHPCTLKGLTYVTSCGCGVCVGRPADKAGCRSRGVGHTEERMTCLGHLQSPGGTQMANALRPKFKELGQGNLEGSQYSLFETPQA